MSRLGEGGGAAKTLLLLLAGAAWICGMWLYRVATSEAYAVAKDFILTDLLVFDEIGEEVHFPLFPGAPWTALFETRDARYSIAVYGQRPNGARRTIVVQMRLHRDEWEWKVEEAGFTDREGKRINVMKLPPRRRIEEFCSDPNVRAPEPAYARRLIKIRDDVCPHLDR